jgi:hypothetical protein
LPALSSASLSMCSWRGPLQCERRHPNRPLSEKTFRLCCCPYLLHKGFPHYRTLVRAARSIQCWRTRPGQSRRAQASRSARKREFRPGFFRLLALFLQLCAAFSLEGVKTKVVQSRTNNPRKAKYDMKTLITKPTDFPAEGHKSRVSKRDVFAPVPQIDLFRWIGEKRIRDSQGGTTDFLIFWLVRIYSIW